MIAAAVATFTQPFMVHAFLAGTVVALATGAVGSLLVLRSELFAADALSHVAFTGAMAAAVLGLSLTVGLVVSCVVGGVGLALLGRRAQSNDVVVGSIFAWVLGLGTLLLSIASTDGSSGITGVAVLFGGILEITAGQVVLTAAIGTVVLVVVGILGRPLVFASIDPPVAEARGLPVTTLSVGLAILVGCTTAMAVETIGALLFVGLLAAPAGVANRLTGNPYRQLAWSMAVAVSSVWIGLVVAGLWPTIPASAAIVAVACAAFAAVDLATKAVRRAA